MNNILTPGVKNLIVINIIIFLLQYLVGTLYGNVNLPINLFALNYGGIVINHYIWTPFTYMFLHGGFWHLLFNMLALFFFGCEIERIWGTRNFIKFYLISGLGAGLIIFLYAILKLFLFGIIPANFTVGASGAIFGILLAYSLLFSERQITLLLFFIIPVTIKAKYLIVTILGITFIFSAFFAQNISHIGHIGGILSAMIFFLFYRKRSPFAYPYQKLRSWITAPFKRRSSRPFSPYTRTGENKFSFRSFLKTNPPKKKKNDFLDETTIDDQEIEARIDILLDKISKNGLKSLSKEEKSFLNRVSLLYRHKFPR